MMAQNEVLRPPTWPDNQVNVFFTQQPGVMFGALIPKGEYLNVSLLGQKLQMESVQEFIDAQRLAAPPSDRAGKHGGLCGCTPRIAVRPAGQFYGQRWTAVGDASVVRLYKDGIGSAFYTAQRAMTTAVEQGISRARLCGGLCALLPQHCARQPCTARCFSASGHIRCARQRCCTPGSMRFGSESALPPERRIHQRILWGMFTGEESLSYAFLAGRQPQGSRRSAEQLGQVEMRRSACNPA